MITTPEEYLKYLWGIESTDEEDNPINPYNNKPILSVILPSDEKTFDVDLDSREISVPTFLSVSKDHRAETIYFLVDRYYDYKDLSETSCMIEFINAEGEGGFYPVPFYDITSYPMYYDEDNLMHEAKMLIPWCIEGVATKGSGQVQFAIRFYELDSANQKFVYNLRTKIATAEVLEGMNESELDAGLTADLQANLIQQFNSKIDSAVTTIYWTDLPDTEYKTETIYQKPDGTPVGIYLNALENSLKDKSLFE